MARKLSTLAAPVTARPRRRWKRAHRIDGVRTPISVGSDMDAALHALGLRDREEQLLAPQLARHIARRRTRLPHPARGQHRRQARAHDPSCPGHERSRLARARRRLRHAPAHHFPTATDSWINVPPVFVARRRGARDNHEYHLVPDGCPPEKTPAHAASQVPPHPSPPDRRAHARRRRRRIDPGHGRRGRLRPAADLQGLRALRRPGRLLPRAGRELRRELDVVEAHRWSEGRLWQ